MKKATRSEKQGSLRKVDITTADMTPAQLLANAPTKIARVLVYLRHCGTLNRFEAARLVGDTCLNSTIPDLEGSYGLQFHHIPEKCPNNWGAPCDVMRYQLPLCAFERADRVLEQMFKRGKGNV